MQPPPEGQWGMPADMLKTLPGYGPDIAQNRQEAREIMSKLGVWPWRTVEDQGVHAKCRG
jgi:peptide/nickel transport system substrate-binding protein